MQLDQAEKGFSFNKEGPLDMRMDPSSALDAETIVNTWSSKALGGIFKEYGEEPSWRKASSLIVEERRKKKFKTTSELSAFLSSILPRRGKLHPATLIFQALRIAVNRELEVLEEALQKAMHLLKPGGRMGVISFHSLEDRIVKNCFRDAAKPMRNSEFSRPLVKLLTKKPLVASSEERRKNRRSRSAKLRFVERL